jgi:hypothetical protein
VRWRRSVAVVGALTKPLRRSRSILADPDAIEIHDAEHALRRSVAAVSRLPEPDGGCLQALVDTGAGRIHRRQIELGVDVACLCGEPVEADGLGSVLRNAAPMRIHDREGVGRAEISGIDQRLQLLQRCGVVTTPVRRKSGSQIGGCNAWPRVDGRGQNRDEQQLVPRHACFLLGRRAGDSYGFAHAARALGPRIVT